MLIKISADKRPLNQLIVKKYFFYYSSKHFAFNAIILSMKKQLIWVFEWREFAHYRWSYILFSPECKELTSMLDLLLYRWGVPPVVIRCVHWTMQMWVLQTWIKAQGLDIVMLVPNSSIHVDNVCVNWEWCWPFCDKSHCHYFHCISPPVHSPVE